MGCDINTFVSIYGTSYIGAYYISNLRSIKRLTATWNIIYFWWWYNCHRRNLGEGKPHKLYKIFLPLFIFHEVLMLPNVMYRTHPIEYPVNRLVCILQNRATNNLQCTYQAAPFVFYLQFLISWLSSEYINFLRHHWSAPTLHVSTVSLHSPHGRYLPAVRAVEGDCQFPLKNDGNSYRSRQLTMHCGWGISQPVYRPTNH